MKVMGSAVYPRSRGEQTKYNLLKLINFYRHPHPTNIFSTIHLVKERLPC